ncbi:penicillin-binding protein activator [Halothiobacillus sp. DCM-1]|uniref:penicillin-binding protein activator n=1 Tax=Halothiobacillus sp. DCM-1 TaxID=3112558 RepID=UPI00324BB2E8
MFVLTLKRFQPKVGLPIPSLLPGLLLAALLLTLAGCAQNPYPTSGTASKAQTELNQAIASREPERIAQAEMALANQSSGLSRAEGQMRALETAIDAEQFSLANRLFSQANTQSQWATVSPRRAALLEGFARWQQGDLAAGKRLVQNLPLPLAPDEAARRLLLLANMDEAAQQPIDAARQRSALNEYLTGQAADQNRAKLWNLLTAAPIDSLIQASQSASNPTFEGWLNLTIIFRSRPGELASWIKNHPDHPAVTSGFTGLLTSQVSSVAELKPSTNSEGAIVVLLPLSGDYQPVSTAITDGLNFAHDRLGLAANQTLQVVDSGNTLASFNSALSTALASHPALIIGPLLKEQFAALNNLPADAPPIIALNTPPDGTALPHGVISDSLSPDADARATADQMIRDQKMTALALCPDNGLGHRICSAFRQEYSLLGGKLIDVAYFAPSTTDFSGQIRQLLGVYSTSKQSFQPKISTDAQGIFLGATGQQVRMIVPQLDYFGADQLPRYGIGMIYSGTPNPMSDQDKSGLVIPVEPLLLAGNSGPDDPMRATYERASLSPLPRLFAFGADALLIAANLNPLLNGQSLTGLTGTLSLAPTGNIERKPAWGQFRQGLLQPFVGTDSSNLPSTVLDTSSPPALDQIQPGDAATPAESDAPSVPTPTPTAAPAPITPQPPPDGAAQTAPAPPSP